MTVITPQEAERRARAALAAGQLESAEALARGLLASGSGPVPIWALLASAVRRQGRIEEAAGIQKMLVEANPGNYDLHFDLAESLLLLGDFERGWREYHYRYRLAHTTHLERKVQTKRWDGRPIPGKSLLIHDEQGFGDTFQFMRMVPWARDRSQARLILQITPEQESLARRMGGFDELVLRGQLPPKFDIHCEMMSLPMAMGLKQSDLPGAIPYLSADKRRLTKWRKRLANLPRPLVALNWAGRPNHFNDANRSMTLADLAPLAMAGVTFLSIQQGPKAAQAKTPPVGMNLVDLSDEIKDFDDTAAIFNIIDLLISVDSSPVHLAGALNRPAWVMLPFVPDWRWLLEREDSAWYPSLRLFRQKKAGDWPDVVRRMAAALAEMAGLPVPVFAGGGGLVSISTSSGPQLRPPPRDAIPPSDPAAIPCQICDAPAPLCGVVDFHKSCLEQNGPSLPLAAVPVYYRHCENCGFLFSDSLKTWNKEDFIHHIYNDQYHTVDPDYVETRSKVNTDLILALFKRNLKDLYFIDYGCGNGSLGQKLRLQGCRLDDLDPFAEKQMLPAKTADVVTAFELLEHSNTPKKTVESITSYVKDDGIIVFSTLLQPSKFNPLGTDGLNWWYIAPRNGHVSIYSETSLSLIFAQVGFQLTSLNRNLHLAYRKLPAFASHLVSGNDFVPST